MFGGLIIVIPNQRATTYQICDAKSYCKYELNFSVPLHTADNSLTPLLG